MFAAQKVIAAFLLPPGCFVLMLGWLGWRLLCKKRRGTGMVLWLLALVIWLTASSPLAGWLMGSLERRYVIPEPVRGDVIILLGGGLLDGVPDLTGRGAPPGDMMSRVVTAVRVQRQLGVPIIVSGGVVYRGMSAEAPIIRRYLVDLGVPTDRVILEERSRDTRENARFCGDILRQRGFSAPLLLTSAYHMRRSLLAFDRVGVRVTPLPANFKQEQRPRVWADYLPQAATMATTAKALSEYLGIAWYQLTFWRRS